MKRALSVYAPIASLATALALSGCGALSGGRAFEELVKAHKGASATCIRVATRFRLGWIVMTHVHLPKDDGTAPRSVTVGEDCAVEVERAIGTDRLSERLHRSGLVETPQAPNRGGAEAAREVHSLPLSDDFV